MKRILIISAVFPPEQVTSAFLNYDLAKSLAENYRVTVLRPKPTRPFGERFPEGWSDPDFETIVIDSYTSPESQLRGRYKETRDFGRKSAQYIIAHKGEIDFIYNDGWQLFGLQIVAKTCVKCGIPYIVPIQDIYPESLLTKGVYPSIIKTLIKSMLLPIDKYYQKHAYRVRTISKEMADYLSRTRKVSREKYLVVNNWQNDEEFSILPQKEEDRKKIVFAYVGSINVHANVDLMIKAFAEAQIPNSEFRIYGGGNQKDKCMQLVKDLGLTSVSFGFVSRTDIPRAQSEADVLVLALPTRNGNLCLPSKLTSYLLSGKPVIASVDSDSSTARILREVQCGISVEADDLESLKIAFSFFSSIEREELTKMGDRSREYALAHLTREVNLRMVVDAIEVCLNENNNNNKKQ